MKKIASILLLAILLFNWVGYKLFSAYMESKSDVMIEARIEQNQFDESELITIKIPTNIPYYINSKEYERVDGEVNINGVVYKYVKRRVFNDSVELVCLPNAAKTNIQNASDEYYKLSAEALNNSTKKSSNHNITVKFSISDFSNDHLFAWHLISSEKLSSQSASSFSVISSPYLDQLEKPPQTLA